MDDVTPENTATFLTLLSKTLENKEWAKLLLSQYIGSEKYLQRITIRPILLKNEVFLSFVYNYKTQDITKNLIPNQGLDLIKTLIGEDFQSAYLFSSEEETQLTISKKGKALLKTHKSRKTSLQKSEHDQEKKRFVDISRPYLSKLGITDKQQKLIPSMASKWKQINKFTEVFSQAINSSGLNLKKPLRVVDFGSGKGYLTFSLHDYLHHTIKNKASVAGVELRKPLVDLCNEAAAELNSANLSFICGDVKTHAPSHVDVMIALHACDTATDYAIDYGIRAQAAVIMCSPCCHKEIRQQIKSPELMQPMLQYGVHMGQQAEMVTDSLRALLLESHGYSAKVFEFISLEHTDKNKMILAVKNPAAGSNKELLEKISKIKEFYGIQEQCLERLLRNK